MEALKRFLGSNKARVMIASLIALIAGWFSMEIPEEQRVEAAGGVAVLGTAIIAMWMKAQGEADQGKEAKKLEIAAASASLTPTPEVPDAGADPGATTPA